MLLSISNSYGGDWCVQVSTFRNIEGARQDFRKVRTNHDARVEKIEGIYALRVGSFDTEAQAKGELKTIRGEFPKAFVRKCADEPDRIIESSQPPKPKKETKPPEQKPDKKTEKKPEKKVDKPPVGKAVDKAVDKPGGKAEKPDRTSTPAVGPAVKSPQVSTVTPRPEAPVKAAASQPSAKVPDPPSPAGPPAAKQTMPNVAQVLPPKAAADKPAAPAAPLPVLPQADTSVTSPPPAQAPPDMATDTSDPQKLLNDAERNRAGGNYTLAIDLYKKVIQFSTPDGELAGRASYKTALCYDIIGEKKTSEKWYDQAIEKWSGLDIAPMPILFAGGMKAYNNKKYEAALKIFSLHHNAYPEDNKRAEYMMACILMQQGRYNAATILFSRILEKYPDSSEAAECIVAFANMGVAAPKMKGTMFTQAWEWHRDPIHAYNTALKMQPDWAASEHILYGKGHALMALGRSEEAHRILIKCLKAYPSSMKLGLYKVSLGANLPPLVKVYYDREDYAGVVSVYFQVSGNDAPLSADGATVIMIGKSLHRIGLNEDASNFLKAARIKAFGKDVEEITKAIDELGKKAAPAKICDDNLREYRDLQTAGQPIARSLAVRTADCLFTARQYADSIPIYKWSLVQSVNPDEKRWILLRMGQAILKTGKAADAKKVFDELKAAGGDEFWSKLADFAYEDGKWTEKYNQISKKK